SLKKQRYKITEEDGNILAEKGRFSRWGPYVNHIGLIIILIAAILRITPFFYLDDYVWLREGEEKVTPGTNNEYYIKNEKFTLERYDEHDRRLKDGTEQAGIVDKGYRSDLKISKVKDDALVVSVDAIEIIKDDYVEKNKPHKFHSSTLYQSGYQITASKTMYF